MDIVFAAIRFDFIGDGVVGGVLRSMDIMSTSLALSSGLWFRPKQSMGTRLGFFFFLLSLLLLLFDEDIPGDWWYVLGDTGDCGNGDGDVGGDINGDVFPFFWPVDRDAFFHLSRIPNMPAELPSFLLVMLFNFAMVCVCV